jgi:hypothetical protein
VLCSLSAIKDLLEKRGEIYSERPKLPIMEMYAFYRYYLPIIRHDNISQSSGSEWIGLRQASGCVSLGAKEESY